MWSAVAAGPGPADAAGAAPVVLVHGSLDRSAGLLRLSRRLARHSRVVRYDRRGYGRSAPHAGPFGLDDHVDDLVHLLDAAGARHVLVGHSYGGNVALAVADRRPDLVTAVAVYESPLSWTSWWPSDTAGSAALAGDADPADAAERFMRRLVGDERWERLPPSTRAARRAEGVTMVEELADLRRGPAWSPERIRCPVVAMWGELGAEHHRRAMREVATSVPDGRAVEIAGARHFGPNTHADQVAVAVLGLLSVGRSG